VEPQSGGSSTKVLQEEMLEQRRHRPLEPQMSFLHGEQLGCGRCKRDTSAKKTNSIIDISLIKFSFKIEY